ncbi:polymer-forming cytoskeletal protein [Myxococcus sp. RHSTA-1-4]|uniref:polymer-forming cytoskeletal protein n=1 Tax=Myxococcus sp. RHSTA-1-4 TaxID=2874601 RepID=UPI001CBE31DE|nr:polymer-forming cytoskeletal protein [Myxococcus sp. RHSTA-1-4]MBZ4422150.1 polymer-forming cytoskeletal protein [Myxococcus sp. RHSTA-1-4]
MSRFRSTQSHWRARHPRAWMLLVFILCAVFPRISRAAELRTGDVVTVGPQEVINDDLYAFGREVVIQGTVRGDVVAAARRLDMRGTVEGDLLSGAMETTVAGPVRGSLRSATGDLTLTAAVGKDALIFGNQVGLMPGTNIPGDLLVAGNEVRVQAPVGGDVRASAQSLTLGAPVSGSVSAEVVTLRLAEGARVGGDLRFTAQSEAQVPPEAVAGRVERLPYEERDGGGGVLGFLYLWGRSIVGLFALGLLLALLAPRLAARAPAELREQPWRSLGWGAVVFVVTPLLAGALFVLGLVVGGWWLGVFALALYVLALLTSFPVVGLLIGRWLLERFGKRGASVILALLVGIVLLTLARRVPILGGLIALATMCFGLGALLLAIRHQRGPAASTPAPA